MKKLVLFAVVGVFLAGCGSIKSAKEFSKTDKGTIIIKIVQINDVYEIAPLGGGEYGGLARVGHVRDSIKALYPNTYLFLAGDFLNPSLLGTLKVDGERLYGKHMVEVLNALEIDLATFGNHEFDLDEEDLQKRMNESNFEWLTANARHVTENGLIPFTSQRGSTSVPASDYSVFEAEGPDGIKMKFGVFGVTIPSNPKDYVSYGDIYENALRTYKLASKESEFVVGLTHVAIAEDIEIAKQLKTVPLIMGGHEHFNMLEKEGQTIITKADANAKSLYVHTIDYNLQTKQLHLGSELMMITENVASSTKVERVVDKWTKLLDNTLKETVKDPNGIIYHATLPLDGTDGANRSMQTNVGDIITRSMANAYGYKIDGALVNGGSVRIDDKLVGDISSKDVFRILPFGGSVLKVDLKGELLIQVLQYGNQQAGTGAYLQRYNFSQSPTGEWLIGGERISSERTYSVAFSDFLLKGLDIPFLTPENNGVEKIYSPEETEIAGDIRKAIIVYLQSLHKK
jgi:2',3'-cyclic-nucleotide 2'-phosphodiesterase (5'-nucleotidase family)